MESQRWFNRDLIEKNLPESYFYDLMVSSLFVALIIELDLKVT